MHVEFETSVESSETAAVIVESQSGGPWPMVILAVVLGGLLSALLWLNSEAAEPLATPSDVEDARDEDADAGADQVGRDEEQQDEGDSDPSTIIPSSSEAAIFLEPTRLGSAAVVLRQGEILRLDSDRDGASTSPPISRSLDGESWEIVDSLALADGGTNQVTYFWDGFRSVGNGLAILAIEPSRETQVFTTSNGRAWVQLRDQERDQEGDREPLFFQPVGLELDDVIGVGLFRSDALAQFVEDHTTAVDVRDACFIASSAVVSCDQTTEWPFNIETIDSPAGTEAVFSCLNLLSVLGTNTVLRHVPISPRAEATEVRVYPNSDFPRDIGEGRVAGIDTLAFFGDPSACDGLADVDQIDPRQFYVFDPTSLTAPTMQRAAFDSAINPGSTELLGELSVGESNHFLFHYGFQLWTLDLTSETWTALDGVATGDRYVLADSGRRLYAFSGSDLLIVDLVIDVSGAVIDLRSTTIHVPLPAETSLPIIRQATQERILFSALGSEWILDVPEEIHCIEQYAEALAGNGLATDC